MFFDIDLISERPVTFLFMALMFCYVLFTYLMDLFGKKRGNMWHGELPNNKPINRRLRQWFGYPFFLILIIVGLAGFVDRKIWIFLGITGHFV